MNKYYFLLLLLLLGESESLIFPRLSLFKFQVSEISEYLTIIRNVSFNHKYHGELAKIQPSFPHSYKYLNSSIIIGKDFAIFEKATDLILNFRITNYLKWAQIVFLPTQSLSVGSDIATLVKCYNIIWALNPCRIVSYDREKCLDKNIICSQVIFSTLFGHLISGEECFRVQYNKLSGDVTYSMSSYSKGCGLLGSLAMPFIRPIQRKFFRDNNLAICSLLKY